MSAAPSAMQKQGRRLDDALAALEGAPAFARSRYQTAVFQLAEPMLENPDGLRELYGRAPRFEGVGVFAGGPWEDPARLIPALVAGGLTGQGVYPVVETLSELRVLAIAMGEATSPTLDQDEARTFLEEVMALNLHWVFPTQTEANRVAGRKHAANVALFALIVEHLGLGNLRAQVIDEIEQVAAQRPIRTGGLRDMIARAKQIPSSSSTGWFQAPDRLTPFVAALEGPAPLARKNADLASYGARLASASRRSLEAEARAMATSMHTTGLVGPHHAVLLRHLRQHPAILPVALGLDASGGAILERYAEDVLSLITEAIRPALSQSIYGLSRLLGQHLLARQEVRAGLHRLTTLDLNPEVSARLTASPELADVPPNAILLAGAIAVFGQPLGVGQGNNPTCQAARAISLWAQHAQGHLLELIVSAAREGFVEMSFEGTALRSDRLLGGVAPRIDFDLDPVSAVLVGHLDRLYDEMMRLVTLRAEDGHKWVNPEMYGRWVPRGFASVFADRGQTQVVRFGDFVRRFYATHHPDYNDGHRMMYPNPVGICVTNSRAQYLGPHAVSVQRVGKAPDGAWRVYFYNPNNEGRQDWGQGVSPSIRGAGELEGESSLPFADFASRLYAFHFNPYEEGDPSAVPDEAVDQVCRQASTSWGAAFQWVADA